MPLYPFLFLVNLLLIPLANNLGQLDPGQALRPALIVFTAAAGLFFLFQWIFKDRQYAAYLVYLAALLFGGFGYLSRFLQDQLAAYGRSLYTEVFLAIITGLVFILATRPVWRRLGGRTWLAPYLSLVVALGLLAPAAKLLHQLQDGPLPTRQATLQASTGSAQVDLDCSNTPDIYYIILDGYGRADTLQALYGLDNQPFLETLRSKGFYVADESHTNYIQTLYAIPAGLNFDYIQPPTQQVDRTKYFSNLVRSNQVMAALKRCGYRTIGFESGFFYTDHPDVDIYFAYGIGANEFESLLLADSPVDVVARALNTELSDLSYAAHRQRVLYTFDKLATLHKIRGPKFVFAHILPPHPPFVFDENGQPLEPARSYYIGDGDDYPGSLAEYVLGYPAQVRFINRELEQMIDAILAHSATPPVIILQGDHGPGSRLVWEAPAQTCLWERTAIFNAYYLPGGNDARLYPAITPVNTFRVVLNTIFSADLPLLPDLTYFSAHDAGHAILDITAQRDAQANCQLTKVPK